MEQTQHDLGMYNVNYTISIHAYISSYFMKARPTMLKHLSSIGSTLNSHHSVIAVWVDRGVRHQLESRTSCLESQMESGILPWNPEYCA